MTTLRNISATVDSTGWVTIQDGSENEVVLTPESATRLYLQLMANQDIILLRHLPNIIRECGLDNLRIPE